MSLKYIGLYSTYYYNRNNVQLNDDAPVINRNYRFKIKKHIPTTPLDERPLGSTVSLYTKYKGMRVEKADIAKKNTKKPFGNQSNEVDEENYRITQEYFMTKERDLALSKNGIKLINKKLLMGDNERLATKKNPVEYKRFVSTSKIYDNQMKFSIGQIKHERSNLLDKYVEIDLELKEIKKKRMKEIEYEIKEFEKRKRHEIDVKFNEVLKQKYAEFTEDDANWTNRDKLGLSDLELELKEYRKELDKKFDDELNDFKKKKLSDFNKEFHVKKFEKVANVHLEENRDKKCTSSIVRGVKSAPPFRQRKFITFEEFKEQQEKLIENLAKYYAIDYKNIPPYQRLHTPTKFQSFADTLQDRLYEQKHKYYPDSFNKKKINIKLSSGYYELMQSPEKLKKSRDSKICSKKKEHEMAEYKAKAYVDLKYLTKKYPNMVIATQRSTSSRNVSQNKSQTDTNSSTFNLENYTDIKDFEELKEIAKKFPYVTKILLNGQEVINSIKSSRNLINTMNMNNTTNQTLIKVN